MKTIAFILLTIFTVTTFYSQSYEIDFAGTGDTTVVDSVLVKNLNQGIFLTIKGNDVLKLNTITGIYNNASDINLLQVYPNPMTEQAEIQFYLAKSSNVMVEVYDVAGRAVIQSNKFLHPGIHKYLVSGLKQGMYIVRINEQNTFKTTKLISQNHLNCDAEIKYVSSNNLQSNQSQIKKIKSTASTIDMYYNEGDRLMFTGMSGNYRTVVTDIPSGNNTITFDFMDCTDGDDNHYTVVKIGTQTWMAENLKTTKYNDSTNIPMEADYTAWANLTTPAYCWLNNIIINKNIYGALYNWYTVETGNLCPAGWHVSTDDEWITLRNYLGGESIAGGKLKETGSSHWKSPNSGATNESGFTALPGACRLDENGNFWGGNGETAFWWSSTQVSSNLAWYWNVWWGDVDIYRSTVVGKKSGMSVRCVRD